MVRAHSDYNLRPRGHRVHEPRHHGLEDTERDTDGMAAGYAEPDPEPAFEPDFEPEFSSAHGARRYGRSNQYTDDHLHSPHKRTGEFVSHGRPSAPRPSLLSWRAGAIAAMWRARLAMPPISLFA